MNLNNYLKKGFVFVVLIVFFVGVYIAISINVHSLPSLIAAIINLSLGTFVYIKDTKNRVNKTFALLSFYIAIWNLDVFGLRNAPTEIFALYWARIFRLGMLFMPPAFLHFVIAFIRSKNRKERKILYIAYTISFALVILSLMGYFETGFIKSTWGYRPQGSVVYKLYMWNFIIFISYGILEIFRKYRRAESSFEKNQLRYFFIAVFVGGLVGSTNFFHNFGIKIYPMGNLGNIAYTSIIAYAIVRHQLMDIRIVIRKSVVYGSLTAAIAGGYFLILSAFAFLLQDMQGHNILATIVFALIVVFGFQPLRDKIQQITDRIFFKDKYDYQKTLREFSGGLSSIIELERLSTLIVDTVTRTMHIDKSSLLLRDEGWKGFKVSLAKGLEEEKVRNINFGSDNQLIRTLSNNGRRILNREEIEIRLNEDSRLRENEEKRKEFEAIKKEMDQLEAMLSIPLMTKNRLIGIFNLGAKKSEDAFTDEDMGLLSTIANQAATALENARLYSERREMEKALHQRDKMAALGTLASGIAHEIKNPLTPIKTFIQLLPRKFDDENFRNKFNSVVPQEIERLDNVLQELTNFSRPAEEKWHPVDVRKSIDEILLLMNGELSKHRINIIKKYEDVPEITADGEHLKQVFMNLILNAIHAMSAGGTLTITTRLSNTETRTEKNLEISFTDSGCGIPPEDIPRLFNAFFTTREKGTGLGLAISRRIIKDHNGSIDVKSEVEKGTTFTINLPLGESESVLSSNP